MWTSLRANIIMLSWRFCCTLTARSAAIEPLQNFPTTHWLTEWLADGLTLLLLFKGVAKSFVFYGACNSIKLQLRKQMKRVRIALTNSVEQLKISEPFFNSYQNFVLFMAMLAGMTGKSMAAAIFAMAWIAQTWCWSFNHTMNHSLLMLDTCIDVEDHHDPE